MTNETPEIDMRISAVESIEKRERKGQSPIPAHCILFDLRSKAREHNKPSEARAVASTIAGSVEQITPFEVEDVPSDDEGLHGLLEDEPDVESVDGGWVSV